MGSWKDCRQALDDLSVSASSVAVGCVAMLDVPCARVAAATSVSLGLIGTGLTVITTYEGQTDMEDLAVAAVTTVVGGVWGGKPGKSMVVGFAASAIQWMWDHWEE